MPGLYIHFTMTNQAGSGYYVRRNERKHPVESRSRLSNALQGNRVPELLAGGYEVVLTNKGEPRIRAGHTAIVACLQDRTGARVALRVANEFGSGLFWQRHYQSMAESLPQSSRHYFPREIAPIAGGITLVGRKMPSVLMEWIDGPTLFEAIERAADRGNRDVLDAIAAALRDLSIGLRDSRVTHGDLTPDNLMLRPNGDLTCVDLDTLEWPGARKRVHDVEEHAYRHPRRSGTPSHQDAFALLVMFVSTMLLRDAPDLREALGQSTNTANGALLFGVWDLRDPRGSETMAMVHSRVSSRGRSLLDILQHACEAEAFRAQQLLDDAFDIANLPESVAAEIPARADATEAVEDEPEDELDIAAAVGKLRELYGYQTTDPVRHTYDYAETWPDSRPAIEPLPPVFDPVWEDEPVVVAPTEVVKRPLERLTRRPLTDTSKVLEEEARAAREIDREVSRLARAKDDARILELMAEAYSRNLVLEESTRRLIRFAQDRTRVRTRLEKALQQNDRRELADLAVSGELALLGDTTRESLVKVLQALEWPTLLRALETDDDTLIMLWFDEEVFEDERSLPHAMRARIDLARNRRAWVDDVRVRLKERNAEALEMLIGSEPENGRGHLSESERRRVRQLIDGKRALAELDRSIRSGNTHRVISALTAVEKTGAAIESPELWVSVRRIVERADLVQATIAAAKLSPPDDRALASLVPQLKSLGIAHDPALRGNYSLDRLQAMIIRGAAVRRIRLGIKHDDDRAIRLAAFPDSTGALALLTSAERERVETARARKRVRRIDV